MIEIHIVIRVQRELRTSNVQLGYRSVETSEGQVPSLSEEVNF